MNRGVDIYKYILTEFINDSFIKENVQNLFWYKISLEDEPKCFEFYFKEKNHIFLGMDLVTNFCNKINKSLHSKWKNDDVFISLLPLDEKIANSKRVVNVWQNE